MSFSLKKMLRCLAIEAILQQPQPNQLPTFFNIFFEDGYLKVPVVVSKVVVDLAARTANNALRAGRKAKGMKQMAEGHVTKEDQNCTDLVQNLQENLLGLPIRFTPKLFSFVKEMAKQAVPVTMTMEFGRRYFASKSIFRITQILNYTSQARILCTFHLCLIIQIQDTQKSNKNLQH